MIHICATKSEAFDAYIARAAALLLINSQGMIDENYRDWNRLLGPGV
jgi:hypothetical protein